MVVIKRDKREENFDIEKIHDVLFWAIEGIKGVNVSDIVGGLSAILVDAPELEI